MSPHGLIATPSFVGCDEHALKFSWALFAHHRLLNGGLNKEQRGEVILRGIHIGELKHVN
jgi:hypothetical protein